MTSDNKTNDDAGLLPCPMSGKKSYLIKEGYNHTYKPLFHVVCHKSGIRTKNYTKASVAIKAWNTRAAHKPVDGWKPIETAPKDGTKVLLYIPKFEHKDYWIEPVTVGKYDHECGWQIEADSYDECYYKPSHWMPLPKPPKDHLLEQGVIRGNSN